MVSCFMTLAHASYTILCPIISWHSLFPGLFKKCRTDCNFLFSVSPVPVPAIYDQKSSEYLR